MEPGGSDDSDPRMAFPGVPGRPAWQQGPLAHRMPMNSEEMLWWPENYMQKMERIRPHSDDADPGMRTTPPAGQGTGAGEFQGKAWEMPGDRNI